MSAKHFSVVGSFLRPQKLKAARADFEAGAIDAAALRQIEDEAIRELVMKEQAEGLPELTDGEFRRATWHLDFMWAFGGVGHSPTETGLPFHDEAAMIDDTYLTGKVSVAEHPFVEHFKFVQALEGGGTAAKQTIPAPAQFLEQMIMPFAIQNTRKYYADTEALARDIVAGYRSVIRQLYDAGCRTVQFDDCSWGMLVDPRAPSFFGTDDAGLKDIMELFLRVNNLAIEGKPEDLVINTHVCRGNFHSTYASSGAYDRVAEYLFARENVNGYFLEFDDARSGGFAPLAKVSGNKKVTLGLITTKTPALEDKATVIRRIEDAARYVPLERLSVSPQCGFASCEIGNKLTEAEQWAKVRLAREIAEEVWK